MASKEEATMIPCKKITREILRELKEELNLHTFDEVINFLTDSYERAGAEE